MAFKEFIFCDITIAYVKDFLFCDFLKWLQSKVRRPATELGCYQLMIVVHRDTTRPVSQQLTVAQSPQSWLAVSMDLDFPHGKHV